jgi:polar amino acid transport system substrate-binding protein
MQMMNSTKSLFSPTGVLRAAYLGSNPAQASPDPVSGELRGATIDITRELARRIDAPFRMTPFVGAKRVIDAVSSGAADIGFVAYAPERVGTVAFSQAYMLVKQSFMVPNESAIQSVQDIDQDGRRVAGGRGDSLFLYLKRNIKQASLVETDNTPADARRVLLAKEADAFGANLQRLTSMLPELPGHRILPDILFCVTQTIVVRDKNNCVCEIDTFIKDIRSTGFLERAIRNSGIVGLEAAPDGYTYLR